MYAGNPMSAVRGVFCWFTILILLNTTFAVGVFAEEAADVPQPGLASADALPESVSAAAGPAPISTPQEFACSTASISEKESNEILNLLKDGFVGASLDAGAAQPDGNRDTLLNPTVILTDEDGKNAAKTDLPGQKVEPFEVAHLLNNYVKGGFAFGLVLEESVRTAKCSDYERNCHVMGDDLKYSNAGTGITSTVKNVAQDAKGLWDEFLDKDTDSAALTPEENEKLRSYLAAEDRNSLEYKVFERKEGAILPNSVLADSFNAKLQTNCTNSSCVLSTYSMFDKYFNSWFSMEMVASNFGPTLLGKMSQAFRWTGKRIWPWRLRESSFMDAVRRSKYFNPNSYLMQKRVDTMWHDIDRHGLGDFFRALTQSTDKGAYQLLETTSFDGWISKQLSPGGMLEDIGKDYVKRAEFVKAINRMRGFANASEAMRSAAAKKFDLAVGAAKKAPNNLAAGAAYDRAKIEYAQSLSDTVLKYNSLLKIDWPSYWSKHYASGLRYVSVYDESAAMYRMFYDDSKNLNYTLQKFSKDGHFGNWNPADYDNIAFKAGKENAQALQLYKASPRGGEEMQVTMTDLVTGIKKGDFQEYFAKVGEDFIPVKKETLGLIEERAAGNVPLYRGGWEPYQELTPEAWASQMTEPRTLSRIKSIKGNTNHIYDVVTEKGWSSRRYTSLLDKAFAEEDALIKSYFSLKGGAKWTAVPFGYWWFKRGLGIEDLSFYQLPDTWMDLEFTAGSEAVYGDAYIDFFANEGSDQGDLFVQLLNKLPWKMVLDEVSDKFNPIRNFYDMLTGKTLRDETENLAYYIAGKDDCPTCSVVIRSRDMKDFSPFFASNQPLTNYILEDTVSREAQEKGQTLISFAHHLNLTGKTKDIEGEEINIAKAMEEEKTCTDKIKETPLSYLNPLKLFGAGEGADVALFYGTMETLSYVTFLWAGIFTSVAMQTLVIPKLQDCVDSEEGYYTHYFIPAQKEEDKQKDVAAVSTEKVTDMVRDYKDRLVEGMEGDDSFTRQAVEEIGSQIDKFAANAADNDIVQATMKITGQSSGQLEGSKLFYFWCAPGCEIYKAGYSTTGKKVITDPNTGNTVEIDNEKGAVSINGKEVISEADIARLSADNAAIPATEIPQNITKVTVPDSEELLMEITAAGEAVLENEQVLACIQAGVKEQTGLALPGNKISDVFGRVEVVITDSHPSIKPIADSILAEGMPRKIAEGADSKISILANKQVLLSNSNDGQPGVGKLRSVQFKNGQFVYKPETNELLIWLRHHNDAVLRPDDAVALKANLATTKNPETECEEPAVDFKVTGNQDSELSQYRAGQFNKSLENFGPFQVFETETKRFILYMDEDCIEHLRVIDKETGQVLADYEGQVQQTPTGIEFIDKDGVSHSLDFSSKDGVPTVSYEGGPPETLRMAEGRNGSFWYDPEKGLWYAENAQLLPLLEAFKQQGISTKANDDGSVTSSAQGNVMNINLGEGDKGFLNLPGLPEDILQLALFIASLLGAITFARGRIIRTKQHP